jgi:hypothetical protein
VRASAGESRSESTSLGRPMEPRLGPRRPARTGALAHGSGLQLELEWAGRARAGLLPGPGGARAGPRAGPAAVTWTPREVRAPSPLRLPQWHDTQSAHPASGPPSLASTRGRWIPGISAESGWGSGMLSRDRGSSHECTCQRRSRVAGLQWHAYAYGSIPCVCISAGSHAALLVLAHWRCAVNSP